MVNASWAWKYVKKRQLVVEEGAEGLTAAEQFYVLAASFPHGQEQLSLSLLLSKICDINKKRQELSQTTTSSIIGLGIGMSDLLEQVTNTRKNIVFQEILFGVATSVLP